MIASVCKWFKCAARDLPWRNPKRRTGYAALVAEMMLQQTQVSRVIDRFESFMRRFPTVRALAASPEQEVMAMWNGLGYYRRARYLHAAARMVVDEFQGRVPSSVAELRMLPGVGRYTAGAIASIVHGNAEPIVDGNVARVLSRVFADLLPRQAGRRTSWHWKRATEMVTQTAEPGVFNEAMMELGAVICTPASPRCGQCPFANQCQARRRGVESDRTNKETRATRRHVHHHAVILRRNGAVLLQQRGNDGMWSGMWQPPTVESDTPLPIRSIMRRAGVSIQHLAKRASFQHDTTHRRITFHVYAGVTRSRAGIWKTAHEMSQLPMSNAHRRALCQATVERRSLKRKRA